MCVLTSLQNTLTYGCICSSGNTPNISDFEQTLPGFVCRQARIDCIAAAPNDLDAQRACDDVVCGSKNIEDASSSTSSSAASSSTTGSSTSSGSDSEATEAGSSSSDSDDSASTTAESGASETSAAADSDSAASALTLASTYGTGLLAVGIFAAFGLAL